jgi:hypothetical protein
MRPNSDITYVVRGLVPIARLTETIDIGIDGRVTGSTGHGWYQRRLVHWPWMVSAAHLRFISHLTHRSQPGGASGEYHGLFHVSTTPPRPTRPHAEVILYQVRAHHAEVILYEVGAPLVYLGKITTHSPIVVHASEQRNYY